MADVTFFKRSFGILHLKRNIYVREVKNESIDAYGQGRKALENMGYTVQAIVLDGRPGVRQSFADLPVQMCYFHQKQIITHYLANNPKLEVGIDLKKSLPRCSARRMRPMVFLHQRKAHGYFHGEMALYP